jgi:hypothetical protein
MVLRVRRRDIEGFASKERPNEPRSCVGRKGDRGENHNIAQPRNDRTIPLTDRLL